jgi:hypothetical protein
LGGRTLVVVVGSDPVMLVIRQLVFLVVIVGTIVTGSISYFIALLEKKCWYRDRDVVLLLEGGSVSCYSHLLFTFTFGTQKSRHIIRS